ncbi:segregation/condensation protein A [Gloeocapsa sp. PCC 73106]|uniref:segregation/condensation protein A n=1 Tax=Gloeocapsa sp. PCC 73106 TaxID=102232 RepID=UPI0002AC5F25|nr:segregation/condensation protein A [Gloeocapsa sp. PCC 73106]ELR96958.1 hypothetical protein GLO73106DRAFT_00007590 [Gloeocapsa sp. PCC 73106]
MTLTPGQIAIAKLIELAETGEINPWDVQVIEVIDRFLLELPEKADLAQSGQAFLWASMLVLLKANTLSGLTDPEIPESEPVVELATRNTHLSLSLEKHLRRRSCAPPVRQRRVTLQELIVQIREIETKLAKKPKIRAPRSRHQSELITQLAHQENLTEIATSLEAFLETHAAQLSTGSLDLEELLELLNAKEQRYEKVEVFWALLLLSAESKVELYQREFYQDLSITPLNFLKKKQNL